MSDRVIARVNEFGEQEVYVRAWLLQDATEDPRNVKVLVERDSGASQSLVVARSNVLNPGELNLVRSEGS